MRAKRIVFLILIMFGTNCMLGNTQSEWESLAGDNLDKWTGNKKAYTFKDGVIEVKPGTQGNLYTTKEYENFHLKFDFKLTAGANNGLGIRTPMKGDAAYVGMELQILDNTAKCYKNLKCYQYHGSVYGTIPALRGYLKPLGEWNRQEVIANGSKIKIILNGTTILDGDISIYIKNGKTVDGKNHPGLGNKKGHIGFLGHGSKLWFKNIEIKELPDNSLADGTWENLFDGQSLDNWKMYNGGKVKGWVIEDGCLVALGKGGDLGGDIITKKQYDNFEFSVDWKTGKGANSGIMYHVVEDKIFGRAPYLTGPEYQIIDDVNYAEINRKALTGYNKYMGVTENVGELQPWCQAGCDYAMHLTDDSKKKLNPCGEWNNSKIVFDNGHVEHWLNGQKILEFTAWTKDWFKRRDSGKWKDKPDYGLSPIGHLCLQDHGARISFKNIKVKQLPKKKLAPVALFNGKDLTGWRKYGQEKWYVEEGLLVCESGPKKKYGYLGTERYYKDFDLNLEFKQLSNGNSGVFIRSKFQGTKVSGWQVEVAPKNKDTGGIYESYGRGWLAKIPNEKENILKVGEWNKMRIKVVGNRMTTWLNGVQMVDLKDDKIGAAVGRIALQIHDGGGIKVQWKNIVIQEL